MMQTVIYIYDAKFFQGHGRQNVLHERGRLDIAQHTK